ncbi:hypothetical protein AKO1_001144, partial [Acrasis kona]
MDDGYSDLHIPKAKGVTMTITNCICVKHAWNRAGTMIEREYLDVVCDDKDSNKNDSYFTKATFDKLYSMGHFGPNGTKNIIWTDGGPKHFKNRYTFRYMVDFFRARNLYGEWHFFESFHGYSLCDSHAGKISQAKTSAELSVGCITDAHDLAELLHLKLSNTSVI